MFYIIYILLLQGALLLDLFHHLRTIVADVTAAFPISTSSIEQDTLATDSQQKKKKKSTKVDVVSSLKSNLLTEKEITERSHLIGLAQSSILCMDVIARNVKTGMSRHSIRDQWMDVMKQTLVDTVALAQHVFNALGLNCDANLGCLNTGADLDEKEKAHLQRMVVLSGDQMKLSGSMFLLCAALCGSLGPAALSSLSVITISFQSIFIIS